MKITSVIEAADALSPNHFTLDEKLGWCDEVSAALRRSVKKHYDMIETLVTCGEELELPDDIPIENVETVYLGGRLLTKTDLRSMPYVTDTELMRRFGVSSAAPAVLRAVYVTMPQKIRNIEIDGNFDIDTDKITASELPLCEGDCIYCEMPDDEDFEPSYTFVLENDGETIYLTDEVFAAENDAHIKITRVIDDETETEAPYDTMYVEYLLSKMAMYQHDYDSYAAHTAQYNNLFEEYRREYKTGNPMNDPAAFKNYWQTFIGRL